MAIRTLSDLDLQGRRVFMRVDFDVPLTPARGLADGSAITRALPSIRYALDRGARLVLASHLGAPDGRPDPAQSLLPVGAFLAETLGREVLLTDEPAGDGARKVIADLREGQVALLENLRFSPGEESNDEAFSRALASYGEVYVNDAFSTLHRKHASVSGMVKHVADKGAGLLAAQEITMLSRLLGEVERPFVAVIGGNRVNDKLALLQSLVGRVDAFVFGGAVANTVLRARGAKMGRSLVEEDRLPVLRDVLTKAQHRDVEVWLPRDVVAAAGVRAQEGRVVPATNVPEDLAALDVGPESARAFADVLVRAKTVFWAGPLGMYESEAFSGATNTVAKALGTATGRGALSIASGGSLSIALRRAGLAESLSHVSTGGAATLELVEGRKLPGIAALEVP